MSNACIAMVDDGVIRGVLATVDCQTRAYAQSGYLALTSGSSVFQTALTALLTIYVALIGYRMLFAQGGSRLSDMPAIALKIGAILAFVSSYVMGGGDLARRGVPEQYREPLLELRRRYSTRPGAADAALVKELGLFDYLSRRLAVCGTPDECVAQLRAARAAGAQRLMFTVSLAADPVRTVQLFGEKVLPALSP